MERQKQQQQRKANPIQIWNVFLAIFIISSWNNNTAQKSHLESSLPFLSCGHRTTTTHSESHPSLPFLSCRHGTTTTAHTNHIQNLPRHFYHVIMEQKQRTTNPIQNCAVHSLPFLSRRHEITTITACLPCHFYAVVMKQQQQCTGIPPRIFLAIFTCRHGTKTTTIYSLPSHPENERTQNPIRTGQCIRAGRAEVYRRCEARILSFRVERNGILLPFQPIFEHRSNIFCPRD